MNIFWLSLSGILGVVGVGLVYLGLLDGHYQVRRSIVIARARAVVFDKIMDFRSWSEWSPWLMHEPDTPLVFSDRPEQVGGYYTWDAKMVGAGKLTHVATKPPTEIKQQIEFIRPFRATCQVVWELAETADGNTKVTWGMDGQMPFLFRFLAKKTAEMISRDYDLGLAMLNGVLDQNADFPRLEFTGRTELAPQRYHYEAYRGGLKGMQAAMAAGFSRLFKQVQSAAKSAEAAAPLRPMTVYRKANPAKDYFQVDMAMPIDPSVQAAVPADAPNTRSIDGGAYFRMTLQGDYRFLALAWPQAFNHLKMRKIKYDWRRPALEIYQTDPATVAQSNDIRTDILLPIR